MCHFPSKTTKFSSKMLHPIYSYPFAGTLQACFFKFSNLCQKYLGKTVKGMANMFFIK